HVPLMSTFWLSNKKGNFVWLEPVVDNRNSSYRFEIRVDAPKNRNTISAGTKRGRGAKFQCLLTDTPIDESHVKSEAKAGRLRSRLIAVVADSGRGRWYVDPSREQETIADVEPPKGIVDQQLADDPRNIWCVGYGLDTFDRLFTSRQLVAMATLSALIT